MLTAVRYDCLNGASISKRSSILETKSAFFFTCTVFPKSNRNAWYCELESEPVLKEVLQFPSIMLAAVPLETVAAILQVSVRLSKTAPEGSAGNGTCSWIWHILGRFLKAAGGIDLILWLVCASNSFIALFAPLDFVYLDFVSGTVSPLTELKIYLLNQEVSDKGSQKCSSAYPYYKVLCILLLSAKTR